MAPFLLKWGAMTTHHLTRELIAAGGIDDLVARDAPGLRTLSAEERAASLRATLDARPAGPAWLFAYGSLIWNPTIHPAECRTARIEGWHRSFCLATMVGRATQDNPGLTLALDLGGSCTGVAFRIEDEALEGELDLLWRREMLSGAYVPRWLDVHDASGARFGSAIAFTMDRANAQYAGTLAAEEVVRRLATAHGAIGTAADYLFATCAGLNAHGIPDPAMEALAREVAEHQRKLRCGGPPAPSA